MKKLASLLCVLAVLGCGPKEGDFHEPNYVEIWACALGGAAPPFFCEEEDKDGN